MSTQCDLRLLELIVGNREDGKYSAWEEVRIAIEEIKELRQAKAEAREGMMIQDKALEEAQWLVDEKNVDVTDHGWRNRRDTFLATFQKQESEREKAIKEMKVDMETTWHCIL